QPRLCVLAEPDQPLAAKRHAVQIVDFEIEDTQVVDEHVVAAAVVVARAGVFARRRESAEPEIHGLLRGGGRRGGAQGKGEHGQRSTHSGTSEAAPARLAKATAWKGSGLRDP